MGVTDALVELDADELPIFDGSAAPFSDLIRKAEVVDGAGEVAPIVIAEPQSKYAETYRSIAARLWQILGAGQQRAAPTIVVE